MIVPIIIGAIILIPIALAIFGAAYEISAARQARKDYATPQGERITVDDRTMHINRMGERKDGQPVVILEASVGANSLDWQMIQPLIAEHGQVISYDRAGNGWSDKADTDRTADILMSELRTLLQNAEIAPPYVLVGHRYGGMYIRKYQDLFPDDVAGLVLLDSSHPAVFDEDNEAEIRRLQQNVNVFQKLGLVRWVTRRNYRVEYLNESDKEKYVAMMMHDNPNLLSEARPVLLDGISLPEKIDVPVLVISRAEDEDLARERKWAERQRDLLTLSDDSEHINTDTTKSWIVFAEPETIANGIISFVERLSK